MASDDLRQYFPQMRAQKQQRILCAARRVASSDSGTSVSCREAAQQAGMSHQGDPELLKRVHP